MTTLHATQDAVKLAEEIILLEKRATVGPWTADRQDEDSGDMYWAVHSRVGYAFITNVHSDLAKHDAAFIIHARTSVPTLARTVIDLTRERDEAVAEVERLKQGIEDIYADGGGPDESGDRYLCKDCGVDLSMRGIKAEREEHGIECVSRALAVLLYGEPNVQS